MSRSDEMPALVFDTAKDAWDGSKGFRRAEVPRPRLDERSDPEDAGRVVVRVAYAGVCGSDRGIWFRTSFRSMILDSLRDEGKTTRVIGHELFGELAEVGSHARAHYRLREGDAVAAESHLVCGRCAQCRLGETHVCSDAKIIGISADGCFAESIKLPADVLWPTDRAKIRPEVAAIQEPFGNAVHASTKVDLRGRSVAIFGCGTIGLFTVLIARALGASRILGVEPNPRNREMAMTLGADAVFAPGAAAGGASWAADAAVVDGLRAATGGVGVDVAIEMAGQNASLNSALASTRRGGDVVLFGLKSADFTIQAYDQVIVNGLTLHSVIGRQIFRTWYLTRSLLEDRSNRIQERIFDVILEGAKDSVVSLASFEPAEFERKMLEHTKLLIRM
jgi:threonine 3-dehydrogenase